jgi:HEPN domain-containing protein
MPVPEAVLKVVREWIVKAEHDLTVAAHILKRGKSTPTETVGFHAQQCVEKYLKASLVYRSIPFAKTHAIADLMTLVPQRYRPALDTAMQDLLTKCASTMRYPGSGPDITLTAARRVRREVRRKLPRAALPK